MNKTLLIIEDNEQNYYMMRFLLEKTALRLSARKTESLESKWP